MRPLLACCFLAVLAALSFAAAPPPRVPPEWLKLIDQLGDDEEDKRASAQKKLETLGEDVLPALRAASKSHGDVDVRLRAAAVILTLTRREVREEARFEGHRYAVTRVIALPDGKRAISVAAEPILWDLNTRKALRSYRAGTGRGLSIDAKGKRFAINSGSRVYVYEVANDLPIKHFDTRVGYFTVAALSPDGKTLFTGGSGIPVRFWDVDSGKAVHEPKKTDEDCVSAAWTPDGKAVVAAHNSATGRPRAVVRTWGAKKGETLWKATPYPKGDVDRVALSADGKRLVTVGGVIKDKTIRVLDATDEGKELAVLKGGHKGGVTAAVPTPDGRRVVSAGRDGAVLVWGVATGKVVRSLEGHARTVYDVAVTPDGKRILSSGNDRTVRIWSMPP